MTPAEIETFALDLSEKYRLKVEELSAQLYAEMTAKEPEYSADSKQSRPEFQLLRARVFGLVSDELFFNIFLESVKSESRRTADQGA